MSDTPASWQPDPTGRHDHRYWDGTRWTEHVADAGVAGVDPFEEATPGDDDLRFTVDAPREDEAGPEPTFGATPVAPAAPAPEADAGAEGEAAGSEPEPAADEPAPADDAGAGASSGWALPTEETPSVSGWGAPAEPETEPAAAEPVAPEAEAPRSGWGETPQSGWGDATAAPASEDAKADADDDLTLAPAASPWEDPTSVASPADAGPAPGGDTGLGGAPYEPAPPAPAEPAPDDSDGGSRKVLLLVLALLVIAGLVIALIALTGGDDDDGGGGGDAGRIADRISEALQRDLRMDEDDADCIGRFITDEIGADELADVDFDQPEAPDDLEEDFNRAFNAAIGECDLDVSDLAPAGDDDASDDADDSGGGAADNPAVSDPDKLREVLTESYRTTLGIEPGKASCLADRMVEAVASGEIDEDDAYGNFFGYLEDCQISLEELTPPAG